MAEIAAIHVLGCIVELRHGTRNSARHSRSDDERDEFDHSKDNDHSQKNVLNPYGEIS